MTPGLGFFFRSLGFYYFYFTMDGSMISIFHKADESPAVRNKGNKNVTFKNGKYPERKKTYSYCYRGISL